MYVDIYVHICNECGDIFCRICARDNSSGICMALFWFSTPIGDRICDIDRAGGSICISGFCIWSPIGRFSCYHSEIASIYVVGTISRYIFAYNTRLCNNAFLSCIFCITNLQFFRDITFIRAGQFYTCLIKWWNISGVATGDWGVRSLFLTSRSNLIPYSFYIRGEDSGRRATTTTFTTLLLRVAVRFLTVPPSPLILFWLLPIQKWIADLVSLVHHQQGR